jgi:hypothetical protein
VIRRARGTRAARGGSPTSAARRGRARGRPVVQDREGNERSRIFDASFKRKSRKTDCGDLRERRQGNAAGHRRTMLTVRCSMMGRRRRARRIGRLVLNSRSDRAAEKRRAKLPRRARSGRDDLHRHSNTEQQFDHAATAHLEFVRFFVRSRPSSSPAASSLSLLFCEMIPSLRALSKVKNSDMGHICHRGPQ